MRKAEGFTLIELLVTMVILGILAAIAIPQYSDYVTRGRIPAATNALSDGRVRMEQFFQDNRTYVGGCAAIGASADKFTISCNAASATTFTITADGTGPMASFRYTIDQTGARNTLNVPSGWSGSGAGCWVVNRGGC
jgi:type IV pilus assembly protein PilE